VSITNYWVDGMVVFQRRPPKFCLLGPFFCLVWRADDRRDAHLVLSLWALPSIPGLSRRDWLGYSLGSLERLIEPNVPQIS
jgi:hypothetical protein